MKAIKKTNEWDLTELPIKMVATLIEWKDKTIKGKDNHPLTLFEFIFKIDDIDGQELFEGLTIKKPLWYKRNEENKVEMSTPNFQVLEALQGLGEDDACEDGDKSEDFDELIGNKVRLQILAPTKKGSTFPIVDQVYPYDEDEDDEATKKAAKKAKKKARLKAEKEAEKKAKAAEVDDDDNDDNDDNDDGDEDKETAVEKKARLKAEKKAEKKAKAKEEKKAAAAKEADDDDDDFEMPDDDDDDDDDDD